ncbi:MAG TPA: glycosyltransferase family 2 protein [Planctomycetota bacterium]|jgi:dolichol-phosphate mannosyltransferase
MSADIELSVLVPCYNEAEVLPLLRERLVAVLQKLNLSWEVIFVDDGSRDGTCDILSKFNAEDSRLKLLSFSRNFGHQAAVMAALSYASGKAVVIMDADLQDSPEVLEQCVAKWREGNDVVYMIRSKRQESFIKRLCYAGFYRVLRRLANVQIPLDSGDFCLMDRRVVDVMTQMPERNLFLRGMRAWAGFKQAGIPVERGPRAAGQPKYTYGKLIALATDGIFSFSLFPLRLATYLGLLTIAGGLLVTIFLLVWRFAGFSFMGHVAAEVPGITLLALGLFVFSGVQLLILGVIGEYLGRVYVEVKARPRWIVNKALGLVAPASGSAALGWDTAQARAPVPQAGPVSNKDSAHAGPVVTGVSQPEHARGDPG